jgi:hypothetical protein
MARYTFSDPQDSKGLSKSGDNLYIVGSHVLRRTRKQPPKQFIYNPQDIRFKKSSLRADILSIARQISDRWKNLSSNQKSSWCSYGSSLFNPVSGFKAFYSNNMHLLRPEHVCLNWIDNITCPPQTVTVPSGISAQFMSIDSFFCVSWLNPVCVNIFIQAFNWLPPGRERRTNQPFKYRETVHSSDGLLSIDSIELDKSRHSHIMLRSLNLRGEISAAADISTIIKTAWPPGRYGIGRYSYSVYGPTG